MTGHAKVLIAAPVYDGKDYCMKEWRELISKIDYPVIDYLLVDNSETNTFYERLKSEGFNIHKIPRRSNSREAINDSMNYIRQYTLDNNYDYLMSIEVDLKPDEQLINRLLAHNKAVVGSYYLLGFKEDQEKYERVRLLARHGLINKAVFLESIKELQFQRACVFYLDYKEDRNSWGTSNITPEKTEELFNTGLQQVHGVGMGATLIRRDILERFPFWTDARFDNKHHDVYFFMDLHNNHIPVYVDTTTLIPHDPSRWSSVEDK